MKTILEKIEKVQNTIEQLNVDEIEVVNMKFNDVSKDELIQLAVQERLEIDEYPTELGVVYSVTWEVCKQLIVVLETNYLPKI